MCGGGDLTNVSILVVNEATGDFADLPFDGIIGLSPKSGPKIAHFLSLVSD